MGTAASVTREDPFLVIRDLMYQVSGVSMNESKRELVQSRVQKRMRVLGVDSLERYVALISAEGGEAELATMVDLLTTNKTNFFRESAHFDFLRRHVLPHAAERGGRLRIWSAGCSSGEEPYSLAMILLEDLPAGVLRDTRVLATDLSRIVLERARTGVYTTASVQEVPAPLRQKYMKAEQLDRETVFRVRDPVRKLVSFSRLNLMGKWPMKGPFDVILCRNVMIYFDRPTRTRLVNRFADLLAPGGYLLVGHSESLNGLGHSLDYVQPAVYRR